ncbi:MAG: glycosyltransferase family 2 protein [Yoonia sp.]|uniref:glycosyltransferase family 2 protein n=1 Tax=Yoonia sp. TaxID=2212373 RepID=UPI003EF8F442
MRDLNPSWAVVATVDEPACVVRAFVAWHLRAGAAHIYLYCDRADDPVITQLAHLPLVTTIACDTDHWQRVGKSRPRRHQVRQRANAQDAYALCQTDWLVHIDADEFLWAGLPIATLLATVDPAADALIVPVAEHVFTPDAPVKSVFQGGFRRPYLASVEKGVAVFGEDCALTYKGLSGHAHGKAFVRCNRPLAMSIHRPLPADPAQELTVARADPHRFTLLHYDAFTPLQWVFKLTRMARNLTQKRGMPPSPHRARQADAILSAPDQAMQVFARLKVVDDSLQALLADYDLWCDPTFDPRGAMAQWFPDQPADISPAMIDDWLHAQKAAVLAYRESSRNA